MNSSEIESLTNKEIAEKIKDLGGLDRVYNIEDVLSLGIINLQDKTKSDSWLIYKLHIDRIQKRINQYTKLDKLNEKDRLILNFHVYEYIRTKNAEVAYQRLIDIENYLESINKISKFIPEDIAAKAEKDPAFLEELFNAFARRGLGGLVSKKVENQPYITEQVSTIALPTVAPHLWENRDKGITPPDFIRIAYAPWVEAGVMTRGTIRECDRALYNAYAQWIHRKPEDAITFAPNESKPASFEPDAEKAIARVRANARAAGARYRANRGTKSVEPT